MEKNLFGQCIQPSAHSISEDPYCENKLHLKISSKVISPPTALTLDFL